MVPSPSSRDRWTRAVDLGARGRYLPAWLLLDVTDGDRDRDTYRSLMHSTRGSHYRQLGILDLARHDDELAVECAADDLSAADAWLGLAADAIAQGMLEPAGDHLDRALASIEATGIDMGMAADRTVIDVDHVDGIDPCEVHSGDVHPRGVTTITSPLHQPWRVAVRASWVLSEWLLLAGRPVESIQHAQAAIARSGRRSRRHRLKSEAILAAGLVAAGRAGEGAAICAQIGDQARRDGWVSLAWPIALIGLAARDAGEGIEVPQVLLDHGAWATRLIEAHLPDDGPDSPAARWRGRADVQRLRSVTG